MSGEDYRIDMFGRHPGQSIDDTEYERSINAFDRELSEYVTEDKDGEISVSRYDWQSEDKGESKNKQPDFFQKLEAVAADITQEAIKSLSEIKTAQTVISHFQSIAKKEKQLWSTNDTDLSIDEKAEEVTGYINDFEGLSIQYTAQISMLVSHFISTLTAEEREQKDNKAAIKAALAIRGVKLIPPATLKGLSPIDKFDTLTQQFQKDQAVKTLNQPNFNVFHQQQQGINKLYSNSLNILATLNETLLSTLLLATLDLKKISHINQYLTNEKEGLENKNNQGWCAYLSRLCC